MVFQKKEEWKCMKNALRPLLPYIFLGVGGSKTEMTNANFKNNNYN